MAKTKSAKKTEQLADKYELTPPDGGWGYLIVAALALGCNVTVIPMAAFGLIYGRFLSSIGDETTGTTLANGLFNTAFNITGLAANTLLQKFSYRFVGLLGAVIYGLGAFSLIFVQNLWQMIISFGIIQGIGMGLIFPALFTALTSFFNKKLNLMNGIAQAVMVATMMVFPAFTSFLSDNFGFRGTVAILAALSFNTILAAVVLQPVEWHMKKRVIPIITTMGMEDNKEQTLQLKPLLELKMEEGGDDKYMMPKPRASIISIGDRALSVTTINRLGKSDEDNARSCWQSFAKAFDLAMFKDPVYVNIALGLSLCFTADVAFISIIPLVLLNSGFGTSEITTLMTVYFGADLVGRIVFSVWSGLSTIRNRCILLGSAILSALFRVAFVMSNEYFWKLGTLSALGFLRAFIQTPLPMVISDQYSNNFATAFSLYMVVCGVVSLVFGPLMSMVKSYTESDIMVVHLLTLAYVTCCVTWTIEFVLRKKK